VFNELQDNLQQYGLDEFATVQKHVFTFPLKKRKISGGSGGGGGGGGGGGDDDNDNKDSEGFTDIAEVKNLFNTCQL
jgi:hypothetical protein